jgi:DNA-binding beta-propeller fold protein YncE
VLRVLPATVLVLVLFPATSAHPAADPALSLRLVLGGQTRGVMLSEARGVAFDPADHAIYVSNTGAHRIEVFSRTGRPLGRFIHRVARPSGELVDGRPTALAFDAAGRLLVVDQLAAYVDVLDRRLRPVTRLAIPDGHPAAVTVGGDGTIWVGTTAEASRVHRFRPDYTPAGAWGEPGTAPGRLQDIAAIAALGDTAVAVACERTDVTVQIFSPAGEYRRGFGTHEVGDGNFSLPSGLVAGADGRLWVLDEIRRSLQVFDGAGNYLTRVTGTGTALGAFQHPSAVAADGRGLIAVADRGLGRVQVFALANEQERAATALQQP